MLVVGRANGAERAPAETGVYGRFDGDLTLSAAAGAVFAGRDRAGASLRLGAHYYSMAGLQLSYDEPTGALLPRTVALGLELRPGFIPRWSYDAELGHSFTDLAIDSIGVGVGVWVAERAPGAPHAADKRGMELAISAGLPLVGTAAGPWLDLAGRLRLSDGFAPPQTALLLLLGWHFVVPFDLSDGRWTDR